MGPRSGLEETGIGLMGCVNWAVTDGPTEMGLGKLAREIDCLSPFHVEKLLIPLAQ